MNEIILQTLFIVLVFSGLKANETGKSNIIIFLSDDHGAEDAGCYGNPDLKTPLFDQLANNALQIYTSDHGPAFPFAKWTLTKKLIELTGKIK